MTKKIAFSLIAALALLAGAAPVFADEPVYVYPQFGGEYTAKSGQLILIDWGWAAATKGLVRVYVNHTEQTLDLLDSSGNEVWTLSPDETEAYWGPILQFGPAWAADALGLDCPMPWVYGIFAEYPTTLNAGTYTLVWTEAMDQPVNDGLHACTALEGEDIPAPSLYRPGTTIVESTIIVTD